MAFVIYSSSNFYFLFTQRYCLLNSRGGHIISQKAMRGSVINSRVPSGNVDVV